MVHIHVLRSNTTNFDKGERDSLGIDSMAACPHNGKKTLESVEKERPANGNRRCTGSVILNDDSRENR